MYSFQDEFQRFCKLQKVPLGGQLGRAKGRVFRKEKSCESKERLSGCLRCSKMASIEQAESFMRGDGKPFKRV